MSKFISEVFKDYPLNDNLISAEIKSMNLDKTKNELQLDIISNKPIVLGEMINFEDYAIAKFNITSLALNIDYDEVEIEQNIEALWKDIIRFFGRREPMVASSLNNSKLVIQDNKITVMLVTKLKFILEAKKINKTLETLFQNLFNKKYIA